MAVRKDESTGKWYCAGKYKDKNGKYHDYKRRGFKTKKEAIEVEKKLLDDYGNGKQTSHRATLDSVFEELILASKGRKKDSTIYKDISIYNKHIKNVFGEKDYMNIKPKELLEFRSKLIDAGLKNSMINNVFKVMSKLYNYMYRMYGTTYNPVKMIGRLKETKRDYETWNLEEFSRFYQCIDNPKYKVAFRLLYLTGMRRGELLGLQWSNYDGRYITINKTVVHDDAEGGMKISTPKTDNSYRKIELDNETITLLDEYKLSQAQYNDFNDDFFIVNGITPLSLNSLSSYKDRIEKISGVKHIRIHDFRHSHVSMLINEGIPLTAIAKRVGDDVATITKTYAHLFADGEERIMKVLNKLD